MKPKPGAVPLFRHLTSVPTAPFRETAVSKKALEWIKTHLPRASVKRVKGGFIVSYRGAGPGPSLCLAAHLDHPAFDLLKVSKTGASARLRGGLPPHLLEGAAVEAFPAVPRDNRPLALGVLGPRPKKNGAPWAIRWTLPPQRGARLDFAVLALPACETKGGWLLSRSVDDLLGCAISLEAMRRLMKAKAKVNLTVLLNRAEEVGFVGALDMIRSGELSEYDSYLSIESSRELPGSRPGRGPTIRLGDKATAFDPNLTALLDAAAAILKKVGSKTQTQRLRLTGGTCEATAYLAFGYEAGGVAVPLVNYHNGWGADAVAPEKVRLSDVEGGTKLLVEASKLFSARILRGSLRARLEKRHDGEKKAL
ncbi:MAG: M20/M25/M40 family metallo-hydrolase [Elusimicrobia bacterium]|nr:M20/M25/M40 family metallo-hydrolase [Elusimicrobiota bacterium]